MSCKREIPADQLTPILAYTALSRKASCLLETADSQSANRRYSFIGIDSIATFTARGQLLEVQKGEEKESFEGDPYKALERLEKCFGIPAVGCISYDAVRCKENISSRHPDLFHLPDFYPKDARKLGLLGPR